MRTRVDLPDTAAMVLATSLSAAANDDLTFGPGLSLSPNAPLAGAPDPGDAASKAKIVRLIKTPMGVNDGRLVVVYGDANHDVPIWEPKGQEHLPRDIFVRYSDDDGVSWSDPVNLSQSADKFSATTDWDGDGVQEPYFGDSEKPNIFNAGNNIVISWVDKYCPESTWTWGDSGESTVQGSIDYADIDVFPNQRTVPFAGVYAAVSNDGGATWEFGGDNAPMQITYGRRDAKQDVHRASGPRWIMTWQEDIEGLQPGEADGPGTGASGAKVSKGTDIWYSFTEDIVADPLALRTNRTPLGNNSAYDMTGTNGYPTAGAAGSIENHGSSRANAFLLNEGGGVYTAIVAYEETKGVPDVLDGKTVQYHSFPFNTPIANGLDSSRSGSAGAQLTDQLENSRRVRFVTQPPTGESPSIAIFWRQGFPTEGGPADIMLKVATAVDEASVMAAPSRNMSTATPIATMDHLLNDSSTDPLEDSRAHRAFIRGDFIAIGYTYTPNGPLARYTDLENYEFWLRRSLDGGVTWLAPQNLSNLTTTQVNVLEPRLVGTPKTGTQDDNAFIVAWGTETNVYEGLEESTPLDIQITRTTDQGATFEPVSNVTATLGSEFESQLRPTEDASEVFAVWMDQRSGSIEAMYAKGGARAPLYVDVFSTPALPGDFIDVEFHAPGFEGMPFLAAASTGFSPGISTSSGVVPLNPGPIFYSSFANPSAFFGFTGAIGPDGLAQGVVALPDNPALSGLSFYVAFLVVPGEFEPWAISSPALIEIE